MASFLDNLLGLNQGDPLKDASKRNYNAINRLDTAGTGYLTEAKGITDDYLDLGKQGATAYADVLGLNGADAASAAGGMFTASPGYQFGLDQGIQALMRQNSALGKLQSGDTDIDLLQYGVKTANDEWGNWLDRLGGYNNMYTQGVGGATKSLGDLTTFKEGITGGLIDSNNQYAEGQTVNNAGIGQLFGNVLGTAGKLFGYGGF